MWKIQGKVINMLIINNVSKTKVCVTHIKNILGYIFLYTVIVTVAISELIKKLKPRKKYKYESLYNKRDS